MHPIPGVLGMESGQLLYPQHAGPSGASHQGSVPKSPERLSHWGTLQQGQNRSM